MAACILQSEHRQTVEGLGDPHLAHLSDLPINSIIIELNLTPETKNYFSHMSLSKSSK